MNSTPDVSVLILAYNLAPYIREAVESALGQETSFPFEIVIAEDGSTDGTREIVAEYAAKYPEKIRALLPEENQGQVENTIKAYEACRGRYIAFLDGDDIWNDTHKLQLQFEVMETHPEWSVSFHNVNIIDETGESTGQAWFGGEKPFNPFRLSGRTEFSLADFLQESFIPTVSVMFRQNALPDIPEWYRKMWINDWPLVALHALRGKIGYIDNSLASYRVRGDGSSSADMNRDRHTNYSGFYDSYLKLIPLLASPERNIARKKMAEFAFKLARTYRAEGDWRNQYRWALKSLPCWWRGTSLPRQELLRLWWPG